MNVANAAKAANPNLSIYTIGYGINGIRCGEDGAGSTFSGTGPNSYATRMYAAMASQPSGDAVGSSPTPPQSGGTCPNPDAENGDGDFYFCLPSTGDLDPVFRQIVTQTLARARLIEFD